jgi:hypothetical protein
MAHQGIDEGREVQFHEMMSRLETFCARYRGVRGELLGKVRDELMQLKPQSATARPTPPAPPTASAGPTPNCRACGRETRLTNDGMLVCRNGHSRVFAG